MSNLLELLKDINLDLDHSSYVYYNNDGSIAKISNRYKDGENYKILKVPYFQVEDIMTGIKKLEDFKVVYDLSVKSFILKEITYEEKLVSIEQRLFELPSYKKNLGLSIIHEDIIFQEINETMDVLIYVKNESYKEGAFVYFNKNVYKLKFDIYNNFRIEDHELYIKDVLLVELDSNFTNFSTAIEPIYPDIFVDIWYDELEHLEGQHVWYNNCVFRMNGYQPKNTEFNFQNVNLIVEDIFIKDKNNIDHKHGNKFLSNNYLYLVSKKLKNAFPSNQIVLIEKTLYITKELNYDIDVTVVQDNSTKSWKVLLNKITRKSLIDTGYNFDDKLSFSITARHDPNILYRTLNFHLKDLINDVKKEYPFIYDWEFNGENVSIYTPKYFENYIHEILK